MSQFDDLLEDWSETPLDSNSSHIPNSGSAGIPESMDLKNQLLQLQQKLNLSDIKPVRTPNGVDPEIHLPPTLSNTMATTTHDNDKSVDFLGDLSDSLLMESRRLNYENKQYKIKVKELSESNSMMKKELNNLNLLNDQLSKREENQTDKIWKLESDLESLQLSLEKSNNELKKVQSENLASKSSIESLKNAIDNLKLEKQQLLDSTNSTIAKLNSQLYEYKESNDSLNDENDILHKNILALKAEVEELKLSADKNPNPVEEETSFSEFDDSIVLDPVPAFLTKDASDLDSKTLKKNINIIHRQMLKLKNQNSKMRLELRKAKLQSPIHGSQVQDDHINPDDSWTKFNDDSFAKKNVPELSYNADSENENDDDNNNNINTSFLSDLSELDGSSPVSSRKVSMAQIKSYMLIVPKTTLDTNPNITAEQIDFSKFKTLKLPENTVTSLLSCSEIVDNDGSDFASSENLQLIPLSLIDNLNDELNSLNMVVNTNPDKPQLSTPNISDTICKLKELRNEILEKFVLLPKTKHADILLEINNLNTEIRKANALNDEQLSQITSLRDQLNDPPLDLLKSKSESLDHIVIPKEKHNDIISKVGALENELETKSKLLDKLNSELFKLQEFNESPDIEYLKNKSLGHMHKLVSDSEYSELLKKISNLEYEIELKSESLSKLDGELSELRKDYESPDINYLKLKASAFDHSLIPQQKYSELLEKYSSLENEISTKTKTITSLESELNETTKKLNNEIKHKESLLEDTTAKLEKLKAQLEEPDLKFIKDKSEIHDHIAIPSAEHRGLLSEKIKLESEVGEKTALLDKMEGELESLKFKNNKLLELNRSISENVEISQAETKKFALDIEQLKKQLEEPSLTYIMTKSKSLNHVVLSDSEHAQISTDIKLAKKKIQELEDKYNDKVDCFEKLDSQLKKTNKSLESTASELDELKKRYENPTASYICSKAPDNGLVAIESENYRSTLLNVENLENKLNEVTSTASRLSEEFKCITSEKEKLEQMIHQPELEYIHEKAAILKHAVLPEDELAEMNSKLTVLEAKLEEKISRLDELQREKDSVDSRLQETLEELTDSQVKFHDLQDEFNKLQKLYDSPTVDYLKLKALSLNMVPVSTEELEKMKREVAKGDKTIEKLSLDIKSLEGEVLKLTVVLSEKEIEYNVLEKEFQKLTQERKGLLAKLDSPDAEFIKSKASLHKLQVISMAQHNSMVSELKTKTDKLEKMKRLKTDLDSKHKQIESLLKSQEELCEKIEKATSNLTSMEKELQTKEFEVNLLQKQVDSPTLDYIKEKASVYKHSLLPLSEVESLKKQIQETQESLINKERELEAIKKIKEDLEIQGSKSVSLELHESTQEDLHVTKRELDDQKQLLNEHKQRIDKLREVENLLVEKESEMVKLKTISSELSCKLEELDLARSEIKDLKNKNKELDEKRKEIESMKKSQNDLQSKIDSLLLKEKELESALENLKSKDSQLKELESAYEAPEFAYLQEKAKSIGYLPIPIAEHNENLRKSDELKAVKSEMRELSNEVIALTSANKSLNETNTKLKSDLTELSVLKDSLESPDLEYLKEKSKKAGLIPLPIDDYDVLNDRLSTMSSEIKTLKSKLDASLAEKSNINEELKKLQHIQANPSMEYLKSKSASLGIIPIPIVEHTSLKSDLKRKNILVKENKQQLEEIKSLKAEISEKKAKLKETIDQLENLEKLRDNPNIEYLESKLDTLSYAAIKKNDLKLLETSKAEALKMVDSLKEKLSDVEFQLIEKESLLDELHRKVEKERKTHERELTEVKSKLALMELNYDNLKSENEVKEGKIEDLTKTVEEVEKSKLTLELQLRELQKQIEASTEAQNTAENKITTLTENINQKELQVQELKSQVESLKRDNKKYESTNEEIKEVTSTLNNDLDCLKKKCELLETEKARYIQACSEFESTISDLKSVSESHEAEKERYREAKSELEISISGLKERCTLHEQSKNNAEEAIASLESELSKLRTELELHVKSKISSSNTIEEMESEICQLKSDIEVQSKSNTELEATVEKLEFEVKRLTEEADVLVQDKRAAQETKADLETEITKLKAQIESHEEEKRILNENIGQLLCEIRKLNEDVSDHEVQKGVASDKIVQSESQIDILRKELRSHQKEKELADAQIISLESKVASLKNEMSEHLGSKDQLASRIAQLESELSSMKGYVVDLEQKKDGMEKEISDLNAESEKVHNPFDKIQSAVNLEDYQKGMNMQKSSSIATVTSENVKNIENQPIELLISAISEAGYTVLSQLELENLLKSRTGEKRTTDLADISHEIENIESDIESKKSILAEMRSRRNSFASSASSIQTTASIPVENILSQKEAKLSEKIKEISASLSDLKAKKEKIQKQSYRLSDVSIEVPSQGLSVKLNKKISKLDSEIQLKEVELQSQQSALAAVRAYLDKSRDLDLPPITTPLHDETEKLESEIKELQQKYSEKKADMEKLKISLLQSDEPTILAKRLSFLGYNVTSPSGESLILEEIKLNGLTHHVRSIIMGKCFDKKNGCFNADQFLEENNLKIMGLQEVERMKNAAMFNIADIPLEDLKNRIKESGYTVVENKDWEELTEKSEEAKMPDFLDHSTLAEYASKLNLSLLSAEDVSRLKQRTITSRELANKANELNLVLLNEDEVKMLKANEPLTKENIVEKAKEFDLLCIPKSQFVATTVSRTPDIPNVTVLPNSYYKILTKSHEWYKKNKNTALKSVSQPPTIAENATLDIPEQFNPQQFAQPPGPGNTHLPGQNIDVLSLSTLDTVVSNKKEIIAAVTQTIIGDYLHKYYRKLGPFTSISDTRHERYFWVHPYSMTLYWCAINPVAGVPAKSQIKALSILDVQSVPDNNPLPPGLYYKSIVIRSYEKTIKITCPTRKIHNIWFNSLRYLLDRTSDSWVNDDDLENQYEQDFSLDKKTEIERMQSLRTPSIKRSPSGLSTRGTLRSASLRSHRK